MLSSVIACLRVLGSSETVLTANAQPVPHPHAGLLLRERSESMAAPRERRGSLAVLSTDRPAAGARVAAGCGSVGVGRWRSAGAGCGATASGVCGCANGRWVCRFVAMTQARRNSCPEGRPSVV
eukprot:6187141-Pleurochrysis_carterae.AAC.3